MYGLCEECQASVETIVLTETGGLCYKCRVNQLENKLAECEKDYMRLRDILKEIEVKARDY